MKHGDDLRNAMELANMTQERWETLPEARRREIRDHSGLTPILTGLEGMRVEATLDDGSKERFIVGRSSGWRPCHIALKRVDSRGGMMVPSGIVEIVRLEKIR